VIGIYYRAKFTNDWNFFVREVGRGNGMEERIGDGGATESITCTLQHAVAMHDRLLS